MKTPKIIIIAGPTASGKTSFAIKLAQELSGEIINADSLQVYEENPILSAQPSLLERQNIPHHLFGYIKGNEEYNIAKWIEDSVKAVNEIKTLPILVGGTGFYLKHFIFGLSAIPNISAEVRTNARALFDNIGAEEFYKILQSLDPEVAKTLAQNNGNRTIRAYEVIKETGRSISFWQGKTFKNFPINAFRLIILRPNREILYQNCNQRFIDMLNLGALDEVKYLLKQDYNSSSGVMKSHGVPELKRHLLGEWTLNQAIDKSQQVVRNYAKRQTTWFNHQFSDIELQTYVASDPINEIDNILDFVA